MANREEIVRLVEASVDALTSHLTAQITDLTEQLQCLKPPSVEAYEPVVLGNNRGSSLDLIKSLPEFRGETKSYPAWRDSAKFAIEYYRENSENYYIAVGIFRNKITGAANDKLASFNTVLNFKAILARLDQCFGDKRSLQSLENEMSILRQGDNSISDFYDAVDQHLTLIINKNKMSYPNDDGITNALNDRARDNALRVFISGLRRPLSDILFAARPCDMPTALATAQELEADQKRQEFARVFAAGDNNKVSRPNRVTAAPLQISHPSYRPKHIQKTTQLTNGNHLKNTDPVPMDVDPSSSMFRRPTAFNGAQNQNNQSMFTGKRELQNKGSGRSAPAQKVQRVNHINTDGYDEDYNDYADDHTDVGSIAEFSQYGEEDLAAEELNFLE